MINPFSALWNIFSGGGDKATYTPYGNWLDKEMDRQIEAIKAVEDKMGTRKALSICSGWDRTGKVHRNERSRRHWRYGVKGKRTGGNVRLDKGGPLDGLIKALVTGMLPDRLKRIIRPKIIG